MNGWLYNLHSSNQNLQTKCFLLVLTGNIWIPDARRRRKHCSLSNKKKTLQRGKSSTRVRVFARVTRVLFSFCVFPPSHEEGRWPWLYALSLSLRGIVTLHWCRRLYPLRLCGLDREVTGASYARVTRQEFSDSRPPAPLPTDWLTARWPRPRQPRLLPPPSSFPPRLF